MRDRSALLLALLLPLAACASGRDAARPGAGEPAAPVADAPVADAAQFRGGPAHPGVYPGGRGFRALGGVAWSVCTGGAVRSSAAVAGGVVYVGSGDGVLRALALDTGAPLWAYDAGSPLASSPAVAGGRVVVVGRDGVAHAVAADDGRRLWTVAAGDDLPMPWGREGWDYFVASPTIAGDTVWLAGGDGVLRRVRLDDGALIGATALGTRLRSSPAVAGGRAFVGGADGVVYAVDAATGRVAWRHATEGASLRSAEHGYDRRTVQSSPAVADGRVFVGGRDARLYALDAATGARLWTVDYSPSWVVSSPAVADGVVYSGTSDAHRVDAVDAATGEVRWTTELGTRVLGSPSLVDGVVMAPGNDGVLHALDAATGAPLWRFRAAEMIQSSPVIAAGHVIIGDDAGHVTALRAPPAGSADLTPRLAVFHDSALAPLALAPGSDRLADDLADAGYQRLDAAGLAEFLAARLDDRAPSVVVFALDHVPAGAAGAAPPASGSGSGSGSEAAASGAATSEGATSEAASSDAGLLRRYLEAGGKVVWVGYPPRSIVRDSTGRPTAFRPERAAAVTGVDFAGLVGDEHGSRPTAAGLRWGLTRTRPAALVPDSAPGATVLARDELGRPAAFVRSFGGRQGTGFVFLYGRGYRPGLLAELRRVAERGVVAGEAGASGAGACPAEVGG